jgi:hypothetical protein
LPVFPGKETCDRSSQDCGELVPVNPSTEKTGYEESVDRQSSESDLFEFYGLLGII